MKYTELQSLAAKFLSCFSSTYCCEQTFSALQNIKSKNRCSISDESLQTALFCTVSNISSRFTEIVKAAESLDSH